MAGIKLSLYLIVFLPRGQHESFDSATFGKLSAFPLSLEHGIVIPKMNSWNLINGRNTSQVTCSRLMCTKIKMYCSLLIPKGLSAPFQSRLTAPFNLAKTPQINRQTCHLSVCVSAYRAPGSPDICKVRVRPVRDMCNASSRPPDYFADPEIELN